MGDIEKYTRHRKVIIGKCKDNPDLLKEYNDLFLESSTSVNSPLGGKV